MINSCEINTVKRIDYKRQQFVQYICIVPPPLSLSLALSTNGKHRTMITVQRSGKCKNVH